MAKKPQLWKKGRGKLGPLEPLLGTWKAQAETPMGPVNCTRTLTPFLGGKYIRLTAAWEFGKGVSAEEIGDHRRG